MTREHFSELLLSLHDSLPEEEIELAALLNILGTRSTGALLLFLALPMVLPIPAPGISVLFGIPLMLISGQLLLGRRGLWLPREIAHRALSRAKIDAYVRRSVPTIRKMEKLVRPRLASLTAGGALRLIGAMSLVLATIITLPVPLGHLVPGIAISAMALGLIEHDGLLILGGLLIGSLALLIVVLAMVGLAVASHSLLPPA